MRSHRSLSTIESPRGHTGLHTWRLSLKVNVRPPSTQTLSKKKTRKATHHKSARTNITHSMSHAYTSKAAHAAPSGNNHTPLSHIQGSETPRSVSLSNGTTNVHHRRQLWPLLSPLPLSFSLLHTLFTQQTHTHDWVWYRHTLLLGSLSGYTIGSAALESLSWWVGSSQRSCIRGTL